MKPIVQRCSRHNSDNSDYRFILRETSCQSKQTKNALEELSAAQDIHEH